MCHTVPTAPSPSSIPLLPLLLLDLLPVISHWVWLCLGQLERGQEFPEFLHHFDRRLNKSALVWGSLALPLCESLQLSPSLTLSLFNKKVSGSLSTLVAQLLLLLSLCVLLSIKFCFFCLLLHHVAASSRFLFILFFLSYTDNSPEARRQWRVVYLSNGSALLLLLLLQLP